MSRSTTHPGSGAWAPGGSEQVYGKGLGEELGKGSRVIMQVHYNLLAGKSPDRSATELRVAPATDGHHAAADPAAPGTGRAAVPARSTATARSATATRPWPT